MKYVITGHTKGLGQILYNYFSQQHDVLGLSKSQGFDISNDDIRPFIDGDTVFINNAYDFNDHLAQSRLVHAAYRCCDHRQIVIGSYTSDFTHQKTTGPQLYSIGKLAVEAASNQMFAADKNITLVKPGYIDVESASHADVVKINPVEISKLIDELVAKPYRTKVVTIVQEPLST